MSTYQAKTNAAKNSKNSALRLMTTSALTAAGLMAFTVSPAKADPSPWSQWITEHGQISISLSELMTLITQHSDIYIGTSGTLNIPEGYTVRITGGSLFAAKAAMDADPTRILGSLISDGKVIILDRNGVFFGQNSHVDAAGLIASTGEISNDQILNNQFGAYTIDNIGADPNARIDMRGVINIADAGLAAFVAPTVSNSGVINARFGKVGFASGEKVTIDPYGDNLFEIEVPGDFAALLENTETGQINAEGGIVQMSAATAEGIVDNMINVNGIVNVSSATMQGGKIILSGGSNGTVTVGGTLDASGTDGGAIGITGKNINVAENAVLNVDGGMGAGGTGNGGIVYAVADSAMDFRGTITGRGGANGGNGGSAEISGHEALGFSGLVNMSAANGAMGSLLLDPAFAIIHSGMINNPLGLNYIIASWALANSLAFSNVTIQADQYIDVGTNPGGYNTGIGWLDAILNSLGGGAIDLSTWQTLFNSGTTNGNLTLDSNTVNFNQTLTMGNGSVIVNANTINLGAMIYGMSGGSVVALGDDRLIGTGLVNTINVLNPNASINQGVAFADGSSAVNPINLYVGAGTYNESVLVNKAYLSLFGAPGHASIIQPNSPGFHVTANNVTIDGFAINGGDNGVLIDGADNVTVNNNTFSNQTVNGVLAMNGSDNVTVSNNIFTMSGIADGVRIVGGYGHWILSNLITGGYWGVSLHGTGDNVHVSDNTIMDTAHNGVDVAYSTGTTHVTNNTFWRSGWDSIKFRDTNGYAVVQGNHIYDVLGASGIVFVRHGGGALVDNNIIDGADRMGIYLWNSDGITIRNNTINNTGREGPGWWTSGIHLEGANNTIVENNTITNTNNGGDGIHVGGAGNGAAVATTGNIIRNNTINNTTGDAIDVENSDRVRITGNHIGLLGGAGNIQGNGIFVHGGSDMAVIMSNIMNNVVWDGILLDGGYGSVISANNITNAYRGIHLINASSTIVGGLMPVFGNIINGTHAGYDSNGIFVEGGSNNTVQYNTVNNSDWDGIKIVASNGTKVLNNLVNNARLSGITIWDSTGNLVQDNTVLNSGDAGIHSNNNIDIVINHNTVNGAGSYGILNRNGFGGTISNNSVDHTGWEGIYVFNNGGVNLITGNFVNHSGNGVNPADGIGVWYTSNATIDNNDVWNAGHDGIHLVGNVNTVVTNNDIRNVINGIGAIGVDTLWIDGNTIDAFYGSNNPAAGGYGIYVVNSHNVQVGDGGYSGNQGNTIDDFEYGIYLNNNTGYVVVDANDITDADYGIYALNNQTLGIYDNFIDGRTHNGRGIFGIYVNGTYDAQIGGWQDGNTVQDFGTGIRVINSDSADVEYNDVSEFNDYGIWATNSNWIDIKHNAVYNGYGSGIRVYGSDHAEINDNDIDDVGENGIELVNSDYVDIFGNTIDHAGHHGIYVDPSNYVDIANNWIHYAGWDGIHVDAGHHADIWDNHIGYTGGDGIDVRNNNHANIWGNYIHDVGANGIKLTGSYDGRIAWNHIEHADENGIYVDNSDHVDVDYNEIEHVGHNGILVRYSDHARIHDNTVHHAGWDGIHVDGGDYADIWDNHVGYTGDDGIDINDNDHVRISGNRIHDAHGNGIEVSDSHHAVITWNDIDDVDDNGIYLDDSDHSFIAWNAIDGADENGIYVNSSSHVDVFWNNVKHAGENGILVRHSDFADIAGNLVHHAGHDGIHVDGGEYADIWNNIIGFVWGDGIDVDHNRGVDIFGNTIHNTGDNGIEVTDSFDADIIGNWISFVGGDGIFASHIFGGDIRWNNISFAGDDGIDVRDSDWVDIVNNLIAFTWGDGIQVRNSDHADINNNLISFAGDDGIDLENSYGSTINGNSVSHVHHNGIEVENSSDIDITNNTVANAGGAGIFVDPSSNIYVGGNTLNDNNVGIHFVNVTSGTIEDNIVNNSLTTGIMIEGSDAIDILFNTITGSGQYGLHVAGGYNGDVRLVGNVFNDNPVGAFFESGNIDITNLDNPNVFNGGQVAMRFSPYSGGGIGPSFGVGGGFSPLTLVDNTLGGTIFNGQTLYYVELLNGALFNPGTPTIIDGTNARFDGVSASDNGGFLTPGQIAAIESKLYDFDDIGTVGQIFVGLPFPQLLTIDNFEDFFRQFNLFSAGLGGLRVTVTGLPYVIFGPGGGIGSLASIAPAAGNEEEEDQNNPEALAGVEPAAGGNAPAQTAQNVAAIEPEAGAEDVPCWGRAVSEAGAGKAVSYNFGGSFAESLADAAACGTSF